MTINFGIVKNPLIGNITRIIFKKAIGKYFPMILIGVVKGTIILCTNECGSIIFIISLICASTFEYYYIPFLYLLPLTKSDNLLNI
jgi:hypothetical protein